MSRAYAVLVAQTPPSLRDTNFPTSLERYTGLINSADRKSPRLALGDVGLQNVGLSRDDLILPPLDVCCLAVENEEEILEGLA
jgi:hypothetical protein